jgi:hypothetical protein
MRPALDDWLRFSFLTSPGSWLHKEIIAFLKTHLAFLIPLRHKTGETGVSPRPAPAKGTWLQKLATPENESRL